MAAEIQVFLLCSEVHFTEDGFDLIHAASNEILTNIFPAEVELGFFMQLRKETADAVPEIEIEIQIHNQDGQLIYGPLTKHVAFTGGHRFAVAKGTIHVTFPVPDNYTITPRVTTGEHISECRYDIDVIRVELPEMNAD